MDHQGWLAEAAFDRVGRASARLLRASELDARTLAAWQRLEGACSEPNVFNQSWLLRSALAHFDAPGHARLFTLWENDRPDAALLGLMPLAPLPRYSRWPLPHLQNWLHHNAFLGTPLVARGAERPFWESLLHHCDRVAPTVGFLHLREVSLDGPLHAALVNVCREQGRRCDIVRHEQRALLAPLVPPDRYYAMVVRKKKRKEIARLLHRLEELGEVSYTQGPSADDAAFEQWIEEFLALEAAGWKGRQGSALGCAPATRGFFVDAVRGARERGCLHHSELRLDGRAIGMLVNFISAPGGFSFKTAYDEAHARFSPGVLVQLPNLELPAQRGLDWIDSCAAADHPMIDSLWAERRHVGRLSVSLRGGLRPLGFRMVRLAENLLGNLHPPARPTPRIKETP